MKKIFSKILRSFAKIEPIYIASRKIVDFHQNENDCELQTNGELHFIQENAKKFSVVFDVGANIGEWSNLVCKEVPSATIYSFEPSKGTFETLRTNTVGSSNIHTQNIGLGSSDGLVDFYDYGNNSVLSSAVKRTDEFGGSTITPVPFMKLDTFCNQNNIDRISFLKIDTEGNELAVLIGGEHMISHGLIDAIQFEYGGTYIDGRIFLKDVFEYFRDKPYSIYKLSQQGQVPCPKYLLSMENFQYANYVALLNK